MAVHPLAGKPAPRDLLVNVPRLVAAYYTRRPDMNDAAQRVGFGTSGHRGSSLARSFNEVHIAAICQAIAVLRHARGVTGPLFLGMDTHALSEPAFVTAVEVFAAHGVELMVQDGLGYTPTPVVSHAILGYNRGRTSALADGVVLTPSHNPPEDGGIKYNPPAGGPADTETTKAIEERANALLADEKEPFRILFERAMRAATTHRHDYVRPYVDDLADVVDMEAIARAGLRLGVDPMGGANVAFWDPIAERYGLDLTVVNRTVDPTFAFMTVRFAAALGRCIVEVPVGLKWFVDGLLDGSLGFGGEESAGASFLRRDGTVWTTDKDGILLDLLAAEMTAVTGKDPGALYAELERRFGAPVYERSDVPATRDEKVALGRLSADAVTATTLAGDPITAKLTTAPGNGAPIGGLKVATANGWFAARPSGTEDVYKIYAESFVGREHLARVQDEARALVAAVLAR